MASLLKQLGGSSAAVDVSDIRKEGWIMCARALPLAAASARLLGARTTRTSPDLPAL